MGTGYLTVQSRTGDDALPVKNAHVTINSPDGRPLYETDTDENGNTGTYALPAPDVLLTLDPYYTKPAYYTYNVDVRAKGFVTVHVQGVEIVDTQTSILPVKMEPLVDEPSPVTDKYINIGPVGLLIPSVNRQVGISDVTDDSLNPDQIFSQQVSGRPNFLGREVIIPEKITVHLGVPSNASARNVTVNFVDYIKNVVSSEIYSTWPYDALVANTHVIVTFALNRVYTEWYRLRGFNFDITNSTSYDQYFRDGAQIFDNISKIVDGIFNVYARRIGFINPFFTQYCNGTTSTCPGLSQWGTVTLANQGLNPLEILHYYYPDDLELVASDNIQAIVESYPGTPLREGSESQSVRRLQNYLNRIRINYPLIPLISNPNGVFGSDTTDAVRTFQRTFNLTADGIVGRDTWNKISFIYVGVIRLAELDSEGQRITIGLTPPNVVLSQGSRGADVLELQFILNVISTFYDEIPPVVQDGVFGPGVKNAVIQFQKTFNLTQSGVVDAATWNELYAVYRGIDENAPVPPAELPPVPEIPVYPGTPITLGSTGPDVRLMQTYLNTIRVVYSSIPYLVVDGSFGAESRRAVIAFQNQFLLTADGIINEETWDKIVEQFRLVTGNVSVSLEYPGTPLRLGSRGSDVRLMQGFLAELRSPYPSLPPIAVDGIYGSQTEAAVRGFQRLFGLNPDGIIGPITWDAIIAARNAAV